jgi:hypothetical protein
MPGAISVGTLAVSAATVVTPTSLLPGLPSVRTAGDWLIMATASTSATATVGTPSGWQSLVNGLGTFGRAVLFARKSVGGGDSAPTVTWSGLTAGSTGTPCTARIINMGVGFGESGGLLIVDATGAVSNQAASTTIMAGGSAVTANTAGAIVFGTGVRQDEAATAIADAGTGAAWSAMFADQSTSGNDMLSATSFAIKNPPGVVGDHTFTIGGGTSVGSSGVMVVVQPSTDAVPTLSDLPSVMAVRT